MPDSEAFDFVEQARIDAQAGMTWDSAPLDDEADDLANGLMQEFFDYQQFLKEASQRFRFLLHSSPSGTHRAQNPDGSKQDIRRGCFENRERHQEL